MEVNRIKAVLSEPTDSQLVNSQQESTEIEYNHMNMNSVIQTLKQITGITTQQGTHLKTSWEKEAQLKRLMMTKNN